MKNRFPRAVSRALFLVGLLALAAPGPAAARERPTSKPSTTQSLPARSGPASAPSRASRDRKPEFRVLAPLRGAPDKPEFQVLAPLRGAPGELEFRVLAPLRGAPDEPEFRFDALRVDGTLHGPESLTVRSALKRTTQPLHRLRRSFTHRIVLETVEHPCLHR